MPIRSFSAGEVIYSEAAPCDAAYIILSGEVELAHEDHVETLRAGEVFGKISLIGAKPNGNSATAKSDVTAQALFGSAPAQTASSASVAVQLPAADDADGSLFPESREKADAATRQAQSFLHAVEGLERVTRQIEKRCELMEQKLQRLTAEATVADTEAPAYSALTKELVEQLSNLGPIMPLLADETVNDILINGHDNIYVERKGLLERTDIVFSSDSEVLLIAEKIVKAVGRKIDAKRPLVDARLIDGSRVNIIAPPLAVDGTSISIRKFSKKKITLDVMKEAKNASAGLAEFLKVAGRCRLNIIVSGGTGSGKTTLLNAISQHIDPAERIVTIEDAAELQLQQPHVIRLETRPYHMGMRREEEVSMRDLVKNALRMRPDRILVGEVRGPEAFDMMQAMNTGHEGSLTTVHANHPRDALSRIENMISMADLQIPMKSLRHQIASALHLIVQISRMRDGHRRISYVSEVVGMEGDMITMHDLFNFVQTGEDEKGRVVGEFKWSGIMPRFVRRVAYYGEVPRLEAAFGVKLPKVF